MAETNTFDDKKGRLDPLILAAAVFFVLAIIFAGVQAFRAGAATFAGLLLLAGLAAIAFIGLIALRNSGREVPAGEPDLDMFVEVLPEPAAIVAADGRILSGNNGWAQAFGFARRLPRSGPEAASLFTAFGDARREGQSVTRFMVGEEERDIGLADLGDGRFLLRLHPRRSAAVPELVLTQPVAAGPTSLDAFASAAPFGAALLEGGEVFGAKILEVNDTLVAMTGGRAQPGEVFGSLVDEASRIDAGLGLSEGRAGPIEVRLAHDATRTAHLYLARTGDSLLIYLVDVSELKAIELQIAQSRKMQAIGQLAGGVAHDFNNLLSAIQFRLDELLQRHSLGDPSYENLVEIRQTCLRAADLVRKLLAMSRRQTVQREALDIGEMVSEFEVLLGRMLREDVKLEFEYGRDLPTVRADKSQIETCVINLAVNARHAVRMKGGGTVKIRTARLSGAEAVKLGYPGGPGTGEMALIEVSDDGPGIPPDVLDKIFEPFFTTKPVGEGTGLGLATVYGIIRQSDGHIHVESEVGKGATFRIFLPVWTPPVISEPPPVQPARPRTQARDLSGAGMILFVEDEEAVRGVAARLLRARGYEVIEAADGEEALILAEEHMGKIDLMISDVIMPGIDGPTLLKKARPFLGNIPVMFISGYAKEEFSDLLEDEKGVSFLAKPIDIKTLAERVKQELAG